MRNPFTLSLFTSALLTALLTSCSAKPTAPTSDAGDSTTTETVTVPAPDTLTFDVVRWKDSTTYRSIHHASVEATITYATRGPQALRDSINTWIMQVTLEKKHLTPAPSDIPQLIISHGKKTLKEYTADVRMLVDEGGSEYSVNYEGINEIAVLYQDADYITLFGTFYEYQAGAHGSTVTDGATFRKSDGKRCGWDLLSHIPRRDLVRQVKNGLMDCFEITGVVEGQTKDEQLRECLMDMDADTYNNHFPLPASEPYLIKKGIVLVYQQYEIAPYAAGMPEVVIKRTK